MQKIVIVKENMSFHLPFEAIMEFGKLKGFDLHCYYNSAHKYVEVFLHDYHNYNNYRFSKKEIKPKQTTDFDWLDIAEPDEIKRDDPNLIKIVEKYKPKSLKIIEIPNNIKWHIVENEEYWSEFVCEDHKTWS